MEKTGKIEEEPIENQEERSPWFRKLAEQSWQAELVISGIAIFGSLRLPELINKLGNWFFITFSEEKFFLLGMIMMYLLLISGSLIVAFLSHFFIRVLWIGMLGLSSVYPKGIQHIKNYSDDFNGKLKQEFPDLELYSHKLDQLGSLIFSVTSAVCMVVITSILTILYIMLISSAVHYLFPAVSFLAIFGVTVLLLLIPGIFGGIFHLKSFHEKEWVKKYHFKIFSYSTKALYTIFYRPFSYIIYTLMSNAKQNNTFAGMVVIFFLTAVIGGYTTANSNIGYFLNTESFLRHASLEYGIKASFYEDQREQDKLILYGSLESDVLKGKFIKVFVPIMGLEDAARERLCGVYEKDEAKADAEKDSTLNYRVLIQEAENDCLERYVTVYLNGEKTKDYSQMKYTHPQTGQFGVTLYVSCAACVIGKNEIKISRPFPVDAEKPYDIFLPFVYEGE